MAGYRLHILKGALDDNDVLIAILGKVSFNRWGDLMTGTLDEGGPLLAFLSCTSSQGVHWTVWQGKDLLGQRLWHVYYPLDADLDPTCTDQEDAD